MSQLILNHQKQSKHVQFTFAGVTESTTRQKYSHSTLEVKNMLSNEGQVLTLLVGGGLDVGDGEVGLGGEGEVAGEHEHQLLGVPLFQH